MAYWLRKKAFSVAVLRAAQEIDRLVPIRRCGSFRISLHATNAQAANEGGIYSGI